MTDLRFEINSTNFRLNKVLSKFKQEVHSFELSSYKSNEGLRRINNSIDYYAKEVNSIMNSNKGFNIFFSLIGFSTAHMFNMKRTGKVLHQMEYKAISHLLACCATGLLLGSLSGQAVGRSLLDYLKAIEIERYINKTSQNLNERYYINEEYIKL